MLSKPESGWSFFQLENTSAYDLSYLNDIAFEWLEQAIYGLETMRPFCVNGFLEPGRFLCTVSYWNCHIICEDDERQPLKNTVHECSHTSMLEFCRFLYNDISQSSDEWAAFASYTEDYDFDKNKALLTEQLDKLKKLIAEKESCFGDDRCFL